MAVPPQPLHHHALYRVDMSTTAPHAVRPSTMIQGTTSLNVNSTTTPNLSDQLTAHQVLPCEQNGHCVQQLACHSYQSPAKHSVEPCACCKSKSKQIGRPTHTGKKPTATGARVTHHEGSTHTCLLAPHLAGAPDTTADALVGLTACTRKNIQQQTTLACLVLECCCIHTCMHVQACHNAAARTYVTRHNHAGGMCCEHRCFDHLHQPLHT